MAKRSDSASPDSVQAAALKRFYARLSPPEAREQALEAAEGDGMSATDKASRRSNR